MDSHTRSVLCSRIPPHQTLRSEARDDARAVDRKGTFGMTSTNDRPRQLSESSIVQAVAHAAAERLAKRAIMNARPFGFSRMKAGCGRADRMLVIFARMHRFTPCVTMMLRTTWLRSMSCDMQDSLD